MISSPPDTASLQLLSDRVVELEQRIARTPSSDSLCIVAYSGEMDRLLAAFTMATGAAASGMEVSMYFTFWATPALKRARAKTSNRPFMDRVFGAMLPGGLGNRRLAKLDFAGVGRRMMKRRMKQMGIAGLPQLVEAAGQLGVEITVCEMSMSLMGIQQDDLIDYPNLSVAGVASFLDDASRSATTLFV